MLVTPAQSIEDRNLLGAASIAQHTWRPLQKKLGLVDEAGAPRFNFHAPRHFAATQWIAFGFSPKRLQALLGHSSIQMTLDRYGHLFPSLEDDHEKFARSEIGLVAFFNATSAGVR